MDKLEQIKKMKEEKEKLEKEYERIKSENHKKNWKKVEDFIERNKDNINTLREMGRIITIDLGENANYETHYMNYIQIGQQYPLEKGVIALGDAPINCKNESYRYKSGEYYTKENQIYDYHSMDTSVSGNHIFLSVENEEYQYPTTSSIYFTQIFAENIDYIETQLNNIVDNFLIEYQNSITDIKNKMV